MGAPNLWIWLLLVPPLLAVVDMFVGTGGDARR